MQIKPLEEVAPEETYDPSPERASNAPLEGNEIDGGMRTGQGADDEPEMTIGDKHSGDSPVDTDGDGILTKNEAEELLTGATGDRKPAALGTQQTTE